MDADLADFFSEIAATEASVAAAGAAADASAAAAAAPPAARLFARGGATVDDVVARLAASITVHDWRLFDGDGGEAER